MEICAPVSVRKNRPGRGCKSRDEPVQSNHPNPLLTSQNLRRHQADPIDTSRMANVDHFGDLSKTQLIVTLHKQHAESAISIYCFKTSPQILPGYLLLIDPESGLPIDSLDHLKHHGILGRRRD